MIRTSLCALLLAFSGLAAAQFLSEEEYWRRVFGFDLTELDDFKAQVREEADRVNALGQGAEIPGFREGRRRFEQFLGE